MNIMILTIGYGQGKSVIRDCRVDGKLNPIHVTLIPRFSLLSK